MTHNKNSLPNPEIASAAQLQLAFELTEQTVMLNHDRGDVADALLGFEGPRLNEAFEEETLMLPSVDAEDLRNRVSAESARAVELELGEEVSLIFSRETMEPDKDGTMQYAPAMAILAIDGADTRSYEISIDRREPQWKISSTISRIPSEIKDMPPLPDMNAEQGLTVAGLMDVWRAGDPGIIERSGEKEIRYELASKAAESRPLLPDEAAAIQDIAANYFEPEERYKTA